MHRSQVVAAGVERSGERYLIPAASDAADEERGDNDKNEDRDGDYNYHVDWKLETFRIFHDLIMPKGGI